MGAGNVKAVYALWGQLPDPSFRLLVYMALTAKDDDDPPVFWGGQESLAIGLGRRAPYDAADHRAVARAMSRLREAGAIVRDRHSAPGQTARHELRLNLATPDAGRQVSEVNTRRDVTGEHPTRGVVNTRRAATEHPTPRDRTPDAWRRAEEEQEEPGLTSGPTTHPSASPQGVAREHEFQDDDANGWSCVVCELPANHPRHRVPS